MPSPSDESLVSTKSKRSRLSKIFRRNSSSSSVATTPASPDARDSSSTKAEPTSAKADSNSIKSKRTPMDKLLRRSSTSSLASVGVTDTQVQASPEPQAKTLKRTDSASSSLSAVVSDAKAEDTPNKSKGNGALRRSLSALSITRPRHRRAASDPLVVDTRSASPPPLAPPEGLHKMLSPVEESPVVVRGSILALEVPPAEPAGAPKILSASGILVDRPIEAQPDTSGVGRVREPGASTSAEASAPAEKLRAPSPLMNDAQATAISTDAPAEVAQVVVMREPATSIDRPPSTGSDWTDVAISSAAVVGSAIAPVSTLPVESAPVDGGPDLPVEPIAEPDAPVVDIVRTPSLAASAWTEAEAYYSAVEGEPSVVKGVRASDSQSTILEPDAPLAPSTQPTATIDIARPPSPSLSTAWTEAEMSSSGVEDQPSGDVQLAGPQSVVIVADATPEGLSAQTIATDAGVDIAGPASPPAPVPGEEAPSDVIEHSSFPTADARSVDTWSDVSSVSSIHFAALSGAALVAAGPSQTEPAHLDHHDTPAPSAPEYAHLGWVVHLPGVDGSTYFTHRGYEVVTDIDLRSNEILYQVSEVLAGLGVPPPTGWELWLRVDGGDSRAPACSFVNHNLRLISPEPIAAMSSIADRERYWAFVEQHPAHCALVVLSEQNINQAKGALTWDRMDWPLTPAGIHVEPPLFTAEERRRFSASINSLDGHPSSYNMIIATRDIAGIMRRLCHWELGIPKPESSSAGRTRNESSSDRRPRTYPRRGPRAMPESGPGGSPLWIVAAGVAVGVGFALIGGGMSRRTR